MAPRNTAGHEPLPLANLPNFAAIWNEGTENVERWGKKILDWNVTERFGKDSLDRNVAEQWGKARSKGTMNEIVEGWGKGFQDRIRSFVPPSRTAEERSGKRAEGGRMAEGGRYAAALEATSGDGGIVTRIAPAAAGRVGVIRASFSSRLPLARIEPPPAVVATSRTEELTKSDSPDREWRNGGAADVDGAGSSGSAGRGTGDADSSAAPPWQMPLREASRKVAELGRAVKGLWKGRKDDVRGAGTGTAADGAGAGKQSSSLASLAQFPDSEERQLAAALASGKRATLIQFYARRCRLCRSLSQLTAELARRNADWLNVVPADVENSRWLPEVGHYSIKYVPCYVLLDGRGRALAKTGEPYSRKHVVKGLAYLVESIRPYRRRPAVGEGGDGKEKQQEEQGQEQQQEQQQKQ
ncbi:unnamed protein product [Closterium sp. Naga37s-1]|nr:unnamed protein product [Closterium sp. Naga37s-1]